MNVKYRSAAGRALGRNLRHEEFAKLWLSFGLISDKLPRARTTHLLFAYPELSGRTLTLGEVAFRPYNLDPAEQFFLVGLTQLRQPQRIFEFGTYDGATTLLLARAAPSAQVLTLDLPPELLKEPGDENRREHERAGGTGSRFHNAPEQERITQLLGDSREFDAAPYEGRMELIIVDGSHAYDCVRSDSKNALRMRFSARKTEWSFGTITGAISRKSFVQSTRLRLSKV